MHLRRCDPSSRLVRRHHGIYHQGWYFPTTYGDDFGYIGTSELVVAVRRHEEETVVGGVPLLAAFGLVPHGAMVRAGTR